MSFNASQFHQFIIEHHIIKLFDTPITLKSGATSHLYINWRHISNDAYLMDQLTSHVLQFVTQSDLPTIHTFYGVAEGATKLGILTQFKYAQQQNCSNGSHTLAMGRAKPKTHGDPTDTLFVGAPTGNICVLEDVTTSGGSLIDCVKQLQSLNMNVVAAIALTNRNPIATNATSTKDALKALNVPYLAMSTAEALLQNYIPQATPSADVLKHIQSEYPTLSV